MSSSNAITRIRRNLFSKNVSTFIICLLLAALLWLVRALNVNYTYQLNVPVKFTNLPSNKVIVGDLPDKLTIEIKTSGLKLFFISLKKNIEELTIDFNALKTNAKSQAYSISNGNVDLKSVIRFNVSVLKIRPDTLFFIQNKGNSKVVPVKINSKINCTSGYSMVSNIYVTPAFVTLTGDSLSLSTIDTVYSKELKLTNVSKNVETTVELKSQSASVNYLTKEVKVNFEVDRITENSVKVPVYIQHKANLQEVKLLPQVVTIYYEVAMNDYNQIDANSFKAVVNYNDIKNQNKDLPVHIIRSPSEVKIKKVEPNIISYLIYKK